MAYLATASRLAEVRDAVALEVEAVRVRVRARVAVRRVQHDEDAIALREPLAVQFAADTDRAVVRSMNRTATNVGRSAARNPPWL